MVPFVKRPLRAGLSFVRRRLAGNREGMLLMGILDGGPAHVAGVREGDQITEIDGSPIRTWTEHIRLPATLTLVRDGRNSKVTVSEDVSPRHVTTVLSP